MADHNKPVLTSTYTNFVSELDARFDDLSVGLDPAVTSATNLPVNTIRWNSVLGKDQKWNGSTWADKSGFYSLGSVRFNNGTAGAPSITFNDDTTTGIFKPTSQSIGFAVSGIETVRLNTSGSLLIGTTIDFARLAVNGSIYTGAGNDVQLGNVLNSNAASISCDSTDTSASLVFKTSPTGLTRTERMRVTKDGNLLIGTTNDDAGSTVDKAKLKVDFSNIAPKAFSVFGTTDNVVNSPVGGMRFSWFGSNNASIQMVRGLGDSDGLGISFHTSPNNDPASEVERARITASGNVLIGSSVDSGHKLAVNGSVSVAGNRITGDFSNASLTNRLSFQTSTSNGSSEVSVLPNGTGNTSGFRAYSSSDVQNSSNVGIQSKIDEVIVEANRTGTASYLPMVIHTGGAEAFRVNTNQTVSGLDVTEINGGQIAGLRNKIINGRFDHWQRGTSFAAETPAYMADRWLTTHVASALTCTYVRQDAIGAWGETQFYQRITRTAGSSVTEHRLQQRIEGVATLAGSRATFSVDCRDLTGARTMSIRLIQNFGSGGSSQVVVSSQNIAVPTGATPQRRFVTFDVPSVIGKTFGANSYLALVIDLPLGDNFQIDISNAQLEAGSVATPFEHRPVGTELTLCQRYCQANCVFGTNSHATAAGQVFGGSVRFPVPMRAAPTVPPSGFTNTNAGPTSTDSITAFGMRYLGTSLAAGGVEVIYSNVISAEL